MFANRFRWTPEQVDAMDSAFVDDLTIYLHAQSDYDADQTRKNKH